VTATEIEALDPGAARLLPLAQRNIRRLGLEDPWADRARGVYRYWWAHNQLLVSLCARAQGELHDAGLQTLLLKGVPLALDYYGDPGLRPMSDFDVLVHRRDVYRGLHALSRLGWAPERKVNEACLRLLHGVSMHNSSGQTLDLHWAIHEEDVRPDADDEAWATAVPFHVAGVQALMPAPAPLLVHALAGGAKWAADPAVRWVADATLIIRRGDVDWDAFVYEVVRRRFVVRVRACIAYLRAALDVQIPASVTARLEAAPVSVFERLEHQLRTRTHRRLGELPRYWFGWARTGPHAWRDIPGFTRYLACTWDLPAVGEVPHAAVSRAAQRLVAGRPRPRPTVIPPGRPQARKSQPR
jgi:hypothetical protein